jgi:general L-amino acid transport system permease protein
MTASGFTTAMPRIGKLTSMRRSIKTNLFAGPVDTIVTVALVSGLLWTLWHSVQWALLNAVGFFGSSEQCRVARGACWAAVGNNLDLLLFGTYPAAERWRPAAALILIAVCFSLLFLRRFRKWQLVLPVYAVCSGLVLLLLLGSSWSGIPRIDADIIGGLTLTFFISLIALPMALPLALVLALARQSELPAIRVAAISYIELVRGLPLIVVLFMAAVLFPLFLEGGVSMAKVFRAMLCLWLFAAAYLAEVIRGGLQSISKGQINAAKALGLRYWQTQFLVVLPQILPIVARPIAGMYITFFKNTSLISVIGLFEITGITTIIIAKPEWAPFSEETYLIVGLVYILCCLAISRLASSLEQQFSNFNGRLG